MKTLLNIFPILFVLIGCGSQQQEVVYPKEVKHRYTTVYEGNKILKYEKYIESPLLTLSDSTIESKPVYVPPKQYRDRTSSSNAHYEEGYKDRKQITTSSEAVARISKRNISDSKAISYSEADDKKEKNEKNESQLGFGFLAFLGIIIAIASMVFAVFTWVEVAVFIGLGLAIASFVLAIIGLIRSKSRKDKVFAWIALSIVSAVGIWIILAAFIY